MVKDMRTRYHLTQQQIADMLGVKQGYIALVEGGKRTPSRQFVLSLQRLDRELSQARNQTGDSSSDS